MVADVWRNLMSPSSGPSRQRTANPEDRDRKLFRKTAIIYCEIPFTKLSPAYYCSNWTGPQIMSLLVSLMYNENPTSPFCLFHQGILSSFTHMSTMCRGYKRTGTICLPSFMSLAEFNFLSSEERKCHGLRNSKPAAGICKNVPVGVFYSSKIRGHR